MIIILPDNFEKIQLYTQQLTSFLQNYTWLLDAYVSDFYFKKHWDKLPESWCSTLSEWTTEELSFLLDRQPVRLRKVAPLSLLSFKACCDTFSFDRRYEEDVSNKLQTLFTERTPSPGRETERGCNQDSKVNPVKFSPLDENGKLHAFFKKHVKPKKQHEIKNLGQVIYLLSEHIKCDTVIDVGSGLGHLTRLLSFGYNLNVTSVEAAGTHAPKATKYDREIDREIKKKIQTTEGKRLVDENVCLPCHVTSIIFPNMSANEFLAIITSQQKQEICSETVTEQDSVIKIRSPTNGEVDTCSTSSNTFKRDIHEIDQDFDSFSQCIGKEIDETYKGVKKLKPFCDSLNQCIEKDVEKTNKDVEKWELGCDSFNHSVRKDVDKTNKDVENLESDCDTFYQSVGQVDDELNEDIQKLKPKSDSLNQSKTHFDRISYDANLLNLNELKGYPDFVKTNSRENTESLDGLVSGKLSSDNSNTSLISTVANASSSEENYVRNNTGFTSDCNKQLKDSSKYGKETQSGIEVLHAGEENICQDTETHNKPKAQYSHQVDSSKWCFVLTGLHACGDLTPTFLRFFVNCEAAVGLASVGCCYMKLSNESTCGETVGYPMSQYIASLPSHCLSYASRELACHFAETYSQRLKECPPLLKNHSYRAALEWIANHLCPGFKRTAVQISSNKTNNLQFDRYVQLGLQKLSISEDRLTDDILNEARRMTDRWKDVVAFYTIRLALAPVVETLVLLDRMIFLYEKGYVSAVGPVFDPGLSPRNFVLLSWKNQ